MIDEIGRGASELARTATIAHMRRRKPADGAVANLVRSGRKQPQRFRAGSSASTGQLLLEFDGAGRIVASSTAEAIMKYVAPMLFCAMMLSQPASAAPQSASPF